jgi:hypothetical protein
MLAQDALAAQRIGGSARVVGCDRALLCHPSRQRGTVSTTTVIEGANAVAVDTETIA